MIRNISFAQGTKETAVLFADVIKLWQEHMMLALHFGYVWFGTGSLCTELGSSGTIVAKSS